MSIFDKLEKINVKKVKKIIAIVSGTIGGPMVKELLEVLLLETDEDSISRLDSDLKEILERLVALEEKRDLKKSDVDEELKEMVTKRVKKMEGEIFEFWKGYTEYHNKNKKSNCKIKLVPKQDTINYVRLGDSVFNLEQILSVAKGTVKLGMRIKDPSRFDRIYSKRDEIEKKTGIHFDWTHNNTNSRLVASVITEQANDSKKRKEVYKTIIQNVYKLLDVLIELGEVKREKVYN